MMNEKNYLVSDEIKDIIDESQFYEEPEIKKEEQQDTSFMIRLSHEECSDLFGIVLKSSIKSLREDYKYTFKFLVMSHELSSFMRNNALYDKASLLIGMEEHASYDIKGMVISELSIEQDLVHDGYIITVSYQ